MRPCWGRFVILKKSEMAFVGRGSIGYLTKLKFIRVFSCLGLKITWYPQKSGHQEICRIKTSELQRLQADTSLNLGVKRFKNGVKRRVNRSSIFSSVHGGLVILKNPCSIKGSSRRLAFPYLGYKIYRQRSENCN